MILPVHTQLRDHIIRTLHALYAIEPADAPPVTLEYPPTRELGDLGTPVAFELARRLRKAPKVIAQEIADASTTLDGVPRVAAANGYLNFSLDRRRFALEWLTAATAPPRRPGKAIDSPRRTAACRLSSPALRCPPMAGRAVRPRARRRRGSAGCGVRSRSPSGCQRFNFNT
jgi:arginyl-tRNA synthetase